MNREGWLTEIAKLAEPLYKVYGVGSKRPYRVTCGWPSRFGLGVKRRTLGECHGPKSSTAGIQEIFISPLLDDPVEVAGTVLHELAHVAAGPDAGHGPKYKRVCAHVGLTKGKPTQALPGRVLTERFLLKVIETLGPYPHTKMAPPTKLVTRSPKDIKLTCPGCGCWVRMSTAWFAKSELPVCGCGRRFEV